MDNLRLYFVTWNVATKAPSQDINALLDFPSQFNKNKPLPDFYILGLQEVKSQPQNMVMDSLFTDPWTSTFNKVLCRQEYVIAKSIRLQGLLLLVYTQLKHITHLRDIEAQYTKTGLGGMWGNKGAISVRFNIYGCSVCFVNCHLTAHEHLLADRVNDYNTIIKYHNYHVQETSNILYHDYVFWIGDLNFRTDHPTGSSPTSEEIVTLLKKVEKDVYTNILRHDQLLAVMESEEAFAEFSEPEIKFPPTYKFNTGTDEYDIKRKPSWTDRILYKVIANNYENITLRADLISYNHVPFYTLSDHKPVVAQFNIKIRHGFIRSLIERESPKPRASIRMRSAVMAPMTLTVDDNAETTSDGVDGAKVVADVCDSNETFSNYTEKTIKFVLNNQKWYIGDSEYRMECILSQDVEIHPNDWIGIYDASFHNLDDYIAYEYMAKVHRPEIQPVHVAPGTRVVILSFPVGSGVRIPGLYRFIYFSQPNNDVRSVLGVSTPFEASFKPESPQWASTSTPSPKPPTTTDVFTDFTGLDVANLSRHFSHDLSID
ncbi:inositol polyphosphate 5-phosphatase K-like isoform X1 [Leguminivora glycinivorella]|uniref:inositol polyphosphate 5-phosphatase K-like isoform X1 n=1 Tax=Leguminivora glycinivorella TaxID=1035111 RepID=UPI00200C4479|nr:inositol polyphosphate 5-phosphatase K-like isoform X1 [Leguminivora glycinivorella]